VKRSFWLAIALFPLVAVAPASAFFGLGNNVERANARLAGCVVDFTNHNGTDRRIWSPALGERRDLYVYLPPGYDPAQSYPVVFWLHGIAQDEQSFLNDGIVDIFDSAIVSGKLPPLVVVVPDGSLTGRATTLWSSNAFLNTDAGRFGDYLMVDVWNFVFTRYSLRPEREAHVLAGVSIGGGNAFTQAIRNRDRIGVVFGIFPPLNLRWMDCNCRYKGKFDPCCWAWRTDISRGHEALARFYLVFTVRVRKLVYPLYGRGPDAIARISADNPIELLDTSNLQPGELEMYVAYAGRDQFNIDAQVESFLYRARQRGLDVAAAYDPRGRHDLRTARGFAPGIIDWLGSRLAPYGPGSNAPLQLAP
jgi:S-formylglutathione hydrolase FrmB